MRSIYAAPTKALPTDSDSTATRALDPYLRFLSVHGHSVAAFSTLAVFGIIYCSISLVNHYLFRTYAWDLGLFNNALYDYAHLRVNRYSLLPIFSNALADHFSLLTPLFSPLYWFFGSYTLLIVQIVAILLGAYGVYIYFSARTRDHFLSLLAMLHFLSLWGIYSALAFDYHENVVAAMLIPWLLYGFETKRWRATTLLFILILVSKENMALWLVAISAGLVLLHFKDRQKVGVALVMGTLSLLYFISVVKLILPSLGGTPGEAYYYHFKFSALGKTFEEAITNILLHPLDVARLLFINHLNDPAADGIKSELHYVILLSGGLALLLRPKYLVMLVPIYAQKLLNDEYNKWGLNYQYSIEFSPIISMALFSVIHSIRPRPVAGLVGIGAVLLTMGTTVWKLESRVSKWYAPEQAQFYRASHYQQGFDVGELKRALQLIPEDAKVSAQTFIVPHLAFRERIYQFPMIEDADNIVIMEGENPYPLDPEAFERRKNELLASSEWHVMYAESRILILERKTPALSSSTHRVQWLDYRLPAEMAAGTEHTVSVTLRNAGNAVWPARESGGGPTGAVAISYHWLPAEGVAPVVWDGTRTGLPHDIAPGDTLTNATVSVTAPGEPGAYRLQLTLVEEGVTWFELQGADTLMVPMSIESGGS